MQLCHVITRIIWSRILTKNIRLGDTCGVIIEIKIWYIVLVILHIVHGPEQISVPSGWAKLNIFRVHICQVRYLSHDRPLNSAAFMWLSPMMIILFLKNNIFVFFNKFQIIFRLKPSSMTVLIEYNCSNTSWYPFRLYVSISLNKSSNWNKFMQKFIPFHNQWKIWTAFMHLLLKLQSPKLARNCTMGCCIKSHLHIVGTIIF